MNMMSFTLSIDESIPIYHQLYNYVKSEIQSGAVSSGSKLPSKRKLSAYLNISQNTIQSAYDQLAEEGYIIPVERKGYYVAKLDNLVKINTQKDITSVETKKLEYPIKYDFSFQSIDMQTFPFSVWRKLTKEAINEYDSDLVNLGDTKGYFELRKNIASYLHQSRGVNCNPKQIIISAGTEYLFQILIQLFNKDYVYGLENPGYERLNYLFGSNRAKFEAIDIDANGMIYEQIKKSNANVICITPSHQFPSGCIMPVNRRIQLLNWANEKEDRYIVEDDYDSEFKYSGKPIPSLQGLDVNEKVIYMGALSKSLSPSIRVSYMVLPEKILKKYEEYLSYIICPVPTIEQKALTMFIQQGYFERHLNKMRNVYKHKREVLVDEFLKMGNLVEILGADAGLHMVLKVNNGMSEEELILSALKKGVKVYGISKYYIKNDGNIESKVILGFASMTEQELIKAAGILKEAWAL